jgi:hypothetical protein
MARPSFALHEPVKVAPIVGGRTVPGGQALTSLHEPEQAGDARPAELPKVPSGQRRQTGAPRTLKVPGQHGKQVVGPASVPGGSHEPAGHTNGLDTVGEADALIVADVVALEVAVVLAVAEGVALEVAVALAVAVKDGAAEVVAEDVAEGVAVADNVALAEGVADTLGLPDADAEGVGDVMTTGALMARAATSIADKFRL